MATNLAKAYVQIVPSAEGMKGMIEQAMGKDPEEAGEKVAVLRSANMSLGVNLLMKLCCWNWKSCISGFYRR